MITNERVLPILALPCVLLALAAGPAPALEDDDFWDEEPAQEEFLSGTGTGGGPMMVYKPWDLDAANAVLEGEGLLGLPEQELYWGGAGWYSITTGEKLFVALGGGGYGGGAEVERGDRYSRWSHSAGWFALKGIYPLHRHLFLEAGAQLGAGNSGVLVEQTRNDGVVEVLVRGNRVFALVRPHAGLDIRISRWVGLLLEGGYSLSSGSWSLSGEETLLDRLDFGDGNGAYASLTVRFGI